MEKQHAYATEVELSDLFLFTFWKTLERGKQQDVMTEKKNERNRQVL